MKKKYFGLRTFKTGLAVTLSIIVARLLNLEGAFFAAIASFITIGKTIGGSYKIGLNRIVGTVIGAIIGMTFTFMLPGNAVLCGIGIIILIILCNKWDMKGAINVAGIVLIANMVNLNGKHPFIYSANRTYETCIGIVIGLIVNMLIKPHYGEERINSLHDELKKTLSELIIQYKEKRKVSHAAYIRRTTAELEEFLSSYRSEMHTKEKHEKMECIYSEVNKIKKMFIHMEALEVIIETMRKEENLNGTEDFAYQYHLNCIEQIYNEL